MSATFNRSAIMKAAHFTARWRRANVGGSYRELFANTPRPIRREMRVAQAASAGRFLRFTATLEFAEPAPSWRLRAAARTGTNPRQ